MILFGQCCTDSIPDPEFNLVVPLSFGLSENQTTIVMPRGRRITLSSRIGFKASSTKRFFWHTIASVGISIVSHVPDNPFFIDVLTDSFPFPDLGVTDVPGALWSPNPSSSHHNNAKLQSVYSQPEGFPVTFHNLSSDSTREFIRFVQAVPLSASRDSFVFRRGDLIATSFHGEDYLATPERRDEYWYRLCDSASISAEISMTVSSLLQSLVSDPGVMDVVFSHPDRMNGQIETEAFALFDIYAN